MADGTWRDRAPVMLRETAGPNGEPCPTPTDRRWLWRLEGFLAVCGTNERHNEMGRDLREYLNETCEHHWSDWFTWETPPRIRQCTWCNDVEQEGTGRG